MSSKTDFVKSLDKKLPEDKHGSDLIPGPVFESIICEHYYNTISLKTRIKYVVKYRKFLILLFLVSVAANMFIIIN